MDIKFIDYLNKDADYKPTCHRCNYSNHVWEINNEWVCSDCLTKEESIKIVKQLENTLLKEV